MISVKYSNLTLSVTITVHSEKFRAGASQNHCMTRTFATISSSNLTLFCIATVYQYMYMNSPSIYFRSRYCLIRRTIGFRFTASGHQGGHRTGLLKKNYIFTLSLHFLLFTIPSMYLILSYFSTKKQNLYIYFQFLFFLS